MLNKAEGVYMKLIKVGHFAEQFTKAMDHLSGKLISLSFLMCCIIDFSWHFTFTALKLYLPAPQ